MSEREQDRQRKAQARASARDLAIPLPENVQRREDLGHNDADWLRHYAPDVFYNPFTNDQLAIIEECGQTLKYGVQKCKAAPRGDGKSSIVKYLMLKYALYRQVRFPLVVAATFGKAQKTTNAIKARLSSKTETPLSLDFPLECHVSRYVHPWPSRARNVTATVYKELDKDGNGVGDPVGDHMRHVNVEWGTADGYFILPTWSAEEPVGPIIMSIGWESDELQGCNVFDVRPDFVMIDDLDSRDSLAAENGKVAGKIEECIDKTIAGMGGQSRRLGQFMLCTITSEVAAAYRYSDPKIKPSWSGERVRAIKKWPDREDLWDKYIQLYQAAPHENDPFHRNAHRFYLENREAMEEGAVVSNPNNFDANELPDGSQREVSNLQRCFNAIAKTSREAFDTEYQNDPPHRADQLRVRIEPYHVARCATERPRKSVGVKTDLIVRGVDVRKTELHSAALASWEPRNNNIIDYDVRSHGTSETTVQQAEDLIYVALHEMADEWDESPIVDDDGHVQRTQLTLIDKGWKGNWTEDGVVKTWVSQPVERFCMERGLDRWMPCKGDGSYRSPKPSKGVIVGDNWHINRGEGAERACDEVIWNANHWHLLVEELFLLPSEDPDRFWLFEQERGVWSNHKAFSNHIYAGATDLKDTLSRGTRSRKPRFVRDHWWDCAAQMLVARSVHRELSVMRARKKPRRSLAEMKEAVA